MLNREIEKKIKDHDAQLEQKTDKATTQNIQQQVNNLVLQAGNPDASSAEIVQARGEYSVLNDRLDAIDNTINTEKTNILKEIKDEFNPTKEEVEKSRVDYFGIEHNNLEERLNEDFDNIHQRVNESSLLPYEGTNISADKSYYGLVKDLSVKGRTLQNLINAGFKNWIAGASGSNTVTKEGYKLIVNKPENTTPVAILLPKRYVPLLKANTKYTVIATISNNTLDVAFNLVHSYQDTMLTKNACIVDVGFNGIYIGSFTTIDDLSLGDGLEINIGASRTGTVTIENYMILEGDYTNVPSSELPYIEDIESTGENEVTEDGKYKVKIKACGRNFFNPSCLKTQNKNIHITIKEEDNVCTINYTNREYGTYVPFYAKQGQTLKIRGKVKGVQNIRIFKYDDNFIGGGIYNHDYFGKETTISNYNFQITETGVYILRPWIKSYSATFTDFIATLSDDVSFEPYKETVVEYLLDEPLRSLPSGVKDTIDEEGVLTKRIGKVVLDGTENWIRNSSLDNEYTERYTTRVVSPTLFSPLICDKLEANSITINDKTIIFAHNTENRLDIKKLKTDDRWTDVLTLKQWLQANPVTVYYELATPITTQLEKPQLFSQDGTTHIFSDNLLSPTISCKIPSNIPAVISALRLENETLQNENVALTEQIEENNIINIETSLEQDARLTMLELGVN